MAQQLGFLDRITQSLMKSKHFNYAEDSMNLYINQKLFSVQDIRGIHNKYGEKLKGTLIKHRKSKQSNHQQQNSKCLIYLHGFGSSRLQSLYLIEHLPKSYCLCTFDLSGSGKSEGQIVTYGMKEHHDIQPIIVFLKQSKNIKEFVLWGRSMGSVATLIYAINKNSTKSQKKRSQSLKNSKIFLSKPNKTETQSLIKGIILDSPFSNFREIAKEIANKKIFIPAFLIDIALRHLEQSFNKILLKTIGTSYNPFNINFEKQINLDIPIICVYSQNDDIINPKHCQDIIKKITSRYEKVLIKDCNHNQIRPKESIHEIFRLLQRFSRLNGRKYNHLQRSSLFVSSSNQSLQRKKGIFVFTPSKDLKRENPSIQKMMKQPKFVQIEIIKTEQMHDKRPKQSSLSKRGILAISSSKNVVKKSKLTTLSNENNSYMFNESKNLINKKLQQCKLGINSNSKARNSHKQKVVRDNKYAKTISKEQK